ncbi:MAG: hypothetical protein WBI25_10880, partial [Smithellaceae bacterium]
LQQAGGGCFAHWKQRLEIVFYFLSSVSSFPILPLPPPKGDNRGRLPDVLDTGPPISRGQAFARMTILVPNRQE